MLSNHIVYRVLTLGNDVCTLAHGLCTCCGTRIINKQKIDEPKVTSAVLAYRAIEYTNIDQQKWTSSSDTTYTEVGNGLKWCHYNLSAILAEWARLSKWLWMCMTSYADILVITVVTWTCQVTFYLPPVFEKRREVLFWGPSPYPPSPPSKPTFCVISRLLLKLAFWNLTCAKYAKTILLKCF